MVCAYGETEFVSISPCMQYNSEGKANLKLHWHVFTWNKFVIINRSPYPSGCQYTTYFNLYDNHVQTGVFLIELQFRVSKYPNIPTENAIKSPVTLYLYERVVPRVIQFSPVASLRVREHCVTTRKNLITHETDMIPICHLSMLINKGI